MAGEVTLALRIRADGTAQVVGDLGKVQAAVAQTQKTAAAAASSAGLMTAAWRSFAASVSIGALTAVTRGAMSFADSLVETADAVGLTTKRFQEFRFAAMQSGVSADAVATGLGVLARKAGEAGISTERALDLIIGRMASAKTQSERVAIAMEYFGRAGRQMALLLADGGITVERLSAQLREMGGVLEDDVARRVAAANDRIEAWANTLKVSLVRAVDTAIGALQRLGDQFAATSGQAGAINFVREQKALLESKVASLESGGIMSALFPADELDRTRTALADVTQQLVALEAPYRERIKQSRESAAATAQGAAATRAATEEEEKFLNTNKEWDGVLKGLLTEQERYLAKRKEVIESGQKAGKSEDEIASALSRVDAEYSRVNESGKRRVGGLSAEEKASKTAAKATKNHADAILSEAKALNLEYIELTRGTRARKEMELAIEGRSDAERQYLLGLYDRNEALKLVQENDKKAAEETKRLAEEGDLAGKALERTAERMTDAFSEFFSDVFRNGVDSFKDLVGTIRDLFFRLLGDLMAAALANPIRLMVGMGASMGSGAASAAMSGASGTAVGGGGFGNILSNAGSFFGGNSFGTTLQAGGAAIQQWMNPSFVGPQTGGLLSGAASIPNWGYGLAGIGGGLLANAVYGGRGYSSLGGSLGATGGMALGAQYGMLAGPLGAVAGSLIGGLVGSLFGGNERQPRATLATGDMVSFEDRRAAEGPFGQVGFFAAQTSRLDAGEFQQTFDAIAATDKVIAEIIGTSVTEQVRRGIEGWKSTTDRVGESGVDLDKMIRERYQRIAALLVKSGDAAAQDLATVLRRRDVTEADMQLAGTYRKMFDPKETIGPFAQAMSNMRAAFEEALPLVESLGLDVEAFAASFARGQEALRKEFDTDVGRQITELESPQLAAIDALGKQFKQMTADAEAVGGSLENVDKLFRLKLLDLFNVAIPGSIEELNANIAQLTDGVDELGRSVDEYERQISSLEGQLGDLESQIKTTRIALLDQQIAQLAEHSSKLTDQLRAIDVELSDSARTLSDLESQIKTTRIALLDQQIAQLAEHSSGLTDELGALNDRLTDSAQTLTTTIDALNRTATQWREFARSIRQTMESLQTSDLSPLTPRSQYEAASSQFEAAFASARSGDEGALGDFARIAEAFLTESQSYYASSPDYVADFERVQSALNEVSTFSEEQGALAEAQAGIEQQTLDTLTEILGTGQAQEQLSTAQLNQLIQQRDSIQEQLAQDDRAIQELESVRAEIAGTGAITQQMLDALVEQRNLVSAQVTSLSQQQDLIQEQLAQDDRAIQELESVRAEIAGTGAITQQMLDALIVDRDLVVAQLDLARENLIITQAQRDQGTASLEELRLQTLISGASQMTLEQADERINQLLTDWRNNPLATGETIPVHSIGTDALLNAVNEIASPIVAAQDRTTDAVLSIHNDRPLIERGPYDYGGMAAGGVGAPGLHLVGERGPELVRFPSVGRVFPAGDTASLESLPGLIAEGNRMLSGLQALMELQIAATGQVARSAEGLVTTRKVA